MTDILICFILFLLLLLFWFISILIRLGFTFSFPMKQHSLDSATLDAWAKSFNLPTVIGTDVVDRLRDSLHKLGHNHIEVVAILNDTTSTLVRDDFVTYIFFFISLLLLSPCSK